MSDKDLPHLLLQGISGNRTKSRPGAIDPARRLERPGHHYRGIWAPGQFSFSNMIEDARAAVTWLRHLSHSDKVDAIEAAGGPKPTRVRFTTDHSYNDHRIAGGGGELAEATFP